MRRLWSLERELGESIYQGQGVIFGLLGQEVAGETGRDFALKKRDWGFRIVIVALEFIDVLVVKAVSAALCIVVDLGVMAVLCILANFGVLTALVFNAVLVVKAFLGFRAVLSAIAVLGVIAVLRVMAASGILGVMAHWVVLAVGATVDNLLANNRFCVLEKTDRELKAFWGIMVHWVVMVVLGVMVFLCVLAVFGVIMLVREDNAGF